MEIKYLENLPVAQLLQNFQKYYGPRKFIIVFTRAHHWPLFWARYIHSIPFYPISLRFVLILFSHLCLRLPSGLFPTKNCEISLTSSYYYHLRLGNSPEELVLKNLTSVSFPLCHWPSFTPIHSYRLNSNFVYFNVHICREQSTFVESRREDKGFWS
jgi:hypothetical protein